MKLKFKRITALTLVIAMILSCIYVKPMTVQAATPNILSSSGDSITYWELDGDIINFTGSTVDTYNVSSNSEFMAAIAVAENLTFTFDSTTPAGLETLFTRLNECLPASQFWVKSDSYTRLGTGIYSFANGDTYNRTTSPYTITYEGTDYILSNPPTENVTTSMLTFSKPVKAGYVYKGMYYDIKHPISKEIVYTSDHILGTPTIQATLYGDVVVRFEWEPDVYLVELDANGGSIDYTSREITYSTTYELPIPNRAGYVFKGWYDENNNLFTQAGTWLTTNDVELTAEWESTTYSITLDTSGGTVENDEIVVNHNEAYNLPIPERKGYTFGGWYKGKTLYSNTGVYTEAQDITLVAKWTANSYKLNFDANTGSCSEVSKDIIYDEVIGELPTPQKPGYGFCGWYTEATGGDLVEATDIMKFYTDTNLYAHWSKRVIRVALDAAGGDISCGYVDITVDDDWDKIPTPVREGYTFIDWYYDNQPIEECNFSDLINDITIRAVWGVNNYTISFNTNSSSNKIEDMVVEYGSVVDNLPVPERDGYVFDGWYFGSVPFANTSRYVWANDIVLKAAWSPKLYTISFDLGGASGEIQSRKIEFNSTIGVLPEPKRAGYVFDGWYYDDTHIETTTKMAWCSDIVLIAVWKEQSYKMYFDGNGGVIDAEAKTYNYGDVIGTLPTPTRDCYIFEGWYLNDEFITEDSVYEWTQNVLVKAKWKKKLYTIKFDSNGGSDVNITLKLGYGDYFKSLPVPEKTGYDFKGWYYNNILVKDTSRMIWKNSITLKASWGLKEYTIKFDANGGASGELERTLHYDEMIGGLPDAARKKYVFAGWYSEKVGGYAITSDMLAQNLGDTVVYAHWDKVTVKKSKITYIKPAKKKLSIKFKKLSDVDGYEIQISTSKKFSKTKTTTYEVRNKFSKTFKNLKSKKTYYVRVRAFSYDSTGMQINGKWSAVKKAKIK